MKDQVCWCVLAMLVLRKQRQSDPWGPTPEDSALPTSVHYAHTQKCTHISMHSPATALKHIHTSIQYYTRRRHIFTSIEFKDWEGKGLKSRHVRYVWENVLCTKTKNKKYKCPMEVNSSDQEKSCSMELNRQERLRDCCNGWRIF